MREATGWEEWGEERADSSTGRAGVHKSNGTRRGRLKRVSMYKGLKNEETALQIEKVGDETAHAQYACKRGRTMSSRREHTERQN